MQVISLGIDYAAYARFLVLTPEVHYYLDGRSRFHSSPFHRSLTDEDYEFCRAFVIESALIAASAQTALALHEAAWMNQDGAYEEGVWDGPATHND